MDQESRFVREAMHAYYNRDAEALRRALAKMEARMMPDSEPAPMSEENTDTQDEN